MIDLSFLPVGITNAVRSPEDLKSLVSAVCAASEALVKLRWHDSLWRLRRELPPGAARMEWKIAAADPFSGNPTLTVEGLSVVFCLPTGEARVRPHDIEMCRYPAEVIAHAMAVGAIKTEDGMDAYALNEGDLYETAEEYIGRYPGACSLSFPDVPLFLDDARSLAPALSFDPAPLPVLPGTASTTEERLKYAATMRAGAEAMERQAAAELWVGLCVALPYRATGIRFSAKNDGSLGLARLEFGDAGVSNGSLPVWEESSSWWENTELAKDLMSTHGLSLPEEVDVRFPVPSLERFRKLFAVVRSLDPSAVSYGFDGGEGGNVARP